ncbi:protein-glutamate O-methyltransferase CheR [Limnobacter sp.]|uniref:CheR family methyltransferase n=1 Tax=Limnobacter sp. TaxID=2003368 RepID=UPI003519A091
MLETEAHLSIEDFRKFQEFFYRKTGIQFDDSKRYFVDKRILERMEATQSDTFRSYFMLLRFDGTGQELQALVNVMTVNETYFFREDYQFTCLVRSMLKEVVQRKQDDSPIRIWSVPSSSGEEAYTIAMHLLETWPHINKYDVEIISSDIDTKILDQARRGLYTARSVQHVPPYMLEKYFRKVGDQYQICDDLRGAVEFTRVNLVDPADVRHYRNFDVVFCRNLLIYFDDLSRRKAAEAMYDALVPGGFVCLGHSESMSRISSLFQARKFPETIVYQKSLEAV